ncbi:MAG TPA: ATP-binding protein [Gemmataceae bacterium]|nr:ATP-binding protein [Gemmataceae bacterium]
MSYSHVVIDGPVNGPGVKDASTIEPMPFSILPGPERLRFETLLANLSATFVNVSAAEVDSHIESGLKQIVEFLDLDRSGLGELSAEGLAITHSYQVPGVPPSPRVILESQFPFYAKKVHEGEVFRLPEDLPAEAVREWEFAAKTGLKSNLTIPLKVTGAVVGGIGFASFRSAREWPDELVQRLRLVGDIFTNALARKRADEALRQATQQATSLRNELAHATRLELISHLTTSIAHEVNQPLYAIASNSQTALDLLGMGDLEEVKKALEDIWADARRASEVIARIRGMVRKEEPRRSPVRLDEVIEELAPLLHREAVSKGATLQICAEAHGVSVVCDRVQMQQVLLNLLLNAVEAVSEPGVGSNEVVIRTWRNDASWVCVSVQDSGVGLTKEACERVFIPFLTTKAKGLGLGLSISRSLVEAHGGNLWATPGIERGTLFHLRLPVTSEGQP